MTNGLSPFYYVGGSRYTTATMQSNDGSAYFDGVSSVTGYYRDDVALNPGTVLRASWSDGAPMVATLGNIIAINLFPDDDYGEVAGDYRQLFINAMSEGAGGSIRPIPEPATWTLGLAGLGFLVLVRRHRRS